MEQYLAGSRMEEEVLLEPNREHHLAGPRRQAGVLLEALLCK